MEKVLELSDEMEDVKKRVAAALHVAVFGMGQTGIATTRVLMAPYTEYSAIDVQKVAVNLLKSALVELLLSEHHQPSERILKDQAEYLSFVCGDG